MDTKSLLSLPIVAHTLLIASAACLVQAHELPVGGAGHLSQRQENAREHFGSLPYGTAIEACNKAGQVALTFDDGPGSFTEELLDLLAYKQATVTFFITGDHNEGSIDDDSTDKPAILRRMLQDGHQIASHGWSHKDMNTIDEKTQRKEIVRNEEAIAEVLGIIPTYFRPPFGSCDVACSGLLKDLGYHNVQWDLDTDDWKTNVDVSEGRYLEALRQQKSALVLAHDIQEPTVRQLAEFMIDEARDLGFQLVTVGECLGDSPKNWYRDANSGSRWQAAAVHEEVSLSQAVYLETTATKSSSESESESATMTAMTFRSTTITDTANMPVETRRPATTTIAPSSSQTAGDELSSSQTEDDDKEASATSESSENDDDDDSDEDKKEAGVGALRLFHSGTLCTLAFSFAAIALLGRLF